MLVPIIICGLVYYKSIVIIEDETNRVNASMLYQLQQGIDGQIQDVERLSMQIALDPNLESMLYHRNAFQAFDHFKITQIINSFKTYKLANSYIKDFYVYIKNNDVILNASSKYDPELLYESMYEDSSIPFEEWHRMMQNYHKRDFILFPNKKEDGSMVNTIAYIQSLRLRDKRSSGFSYHYT